MPSLCDHSRTGSITNMGAAKRRRAEIEMLKRASPEEAARWRQARGDEKRLVRALIAERAEPPIGSRLIDAGQQPLHNLPVRIATGRDLLHRLLSEELGLLFGLSFISRKRHPLADDFSPRRVFRLHAQNPLVSSVVKHI
jgi:hypothetical protein